MDSALVGKRVRCKGCETVFQVSGTSTGSFPAAGARPRPQAEAAPDASWLDEGAEGEPASPVMPRSRPRPAGAGGGPSTTQTVLIASGAATLLALVIGMAVVLNQGMGPAPAGPNPAPPAAPGPSGPGMFQRVMDAVSGSDATDATESVAGYPPLGPLPPPLVPPPPLRDLAAHERQSRSYIAAIDRMAGIMASIHDLSSLQAAGPQFEDVKRRLTEEQTRNPPPFRLTVAENAEVTRRHADEMRAAMRRVRDESQRLANLPGIGTAGIQLSQLSSVLAGPAEQALKDAENFKPPSGPEPYVEIYLQFRGPEDAAYFQHKFEQSVDGSKGVQMTRQTGGEVHRASCRVWPVDDPSWFAGRIPSAKAVVKGRRIFVTGEVVPADELAAAQEVLKERQDKLDAAVAAMKKPMPKPEDDDPKPPADADDVTRAVFALRSASADRRKDGIAQIARITPVDGRRAEVHGPLAAILAGPDIFLVTDAMKAMVLWRTDDTVPALIKVLDRPEHNLRWAAAEQLGKLGDARAGEPLAARIKEDGIAVEPALRALGPAAEPALIGLLRNPEWTIRARACEILAQVGGKPTLEAMSAMPADPQFIVQSAARDAMWAIQARVGPLEPARKGGAAKGKAGRPG
ncbi:MAG: hypothetical protein BGO49_29070 [Planctomycetales bacterium 71-10]|nr:MAG: hypothetical protein BGO49_29070 [Planctomycetales bacterium 71-10]